MTKTISDVEAYWDSRPCNIRRSPNPVGSLQFFFDTEKNKYFVEPHIPKFAEFEKWAGKRVIEFGCGLGIDAVNFARAGADVYAMDLSAKSVDLAVKRFEQEGLDGTFFIANAESCPAVGNVDLVYAFGSIHHSPSPEKILINARESLKPGGTLKIMVYNKYSWKALWILLKYGYGQFWKFRELVAKYSEAQTGCPVTHVYSPRELRAMLERNGFIVRKMYKDHVFPYDITSYKRHEYKKIFIFRYMPARMFRWLEQHFGWHLLCEVTC